MGARAALFGGHCCNGSACKCGWDGWVVNGACNEMCVFTGSVLCGAGGEIQNVNAKVFWGEGARGL